MVDSAFSKRARPSIVCVGALLAVAMPAATARAQTDEDEGPDIDWVLAGKQANLGRVAVFNVPDGYRLAKANDARKLLEMMGNPTNGTELGLVFSEDRDWFVTFEFSDIGYVKDDEKDELDADAILESIRDGNDAANETRRERGWPELEITGWEQEPRYDTETRNLVWAVRAESEGEPVINYNTRRLGRTGVMNITVVADPQDLAAAVPAFNRLMIGFDFVSGKRYGDFCAGDKIAEYGLTALITGGAAAVAIKSGLFKWLWKAIVAGFVAIVAAFKALFRRRGNDSAR